MKRRANTTKLDERTVAIIKGMVARGDRQMDVAVWAGINQGRVCEIHRASGYGKRYAHVAPAPLDQLPEPGPYVIVARATHDRHEVAQEVVRQLELLLERYKHNIAKSQRISTVNEAV